MTDLPSLPDLTEAFFQDLREALEASGHISRDLPAPDFAAFRHQTMQRVRWGQEEYGEAWRGRDTIPEALEELPDAAVYAAGEMGKAGRHGELLAAGFYSYLAYAALRRYMAERDAG